MVSLAVGGQSRRTMISGRLTAAFFFLSFMPSTVRRVNLFLSTLLLALARTISRPSTLPSDTVISPVQSLAFWSLRPKLTARLTRLAGQGTGAPAGRALGLVV